MVPPPRRLTWTPSRSRARRHGREAHRDTERLPLAPRPVRARGSEVQVARVVRSAIGTSAGGSGSPRTSSASVRVNSVTQISPGVITSSIVRVQSSRVAPPVIWKSRSSFRVTQVCAWRSPSEPSGLNGHHSRTAGSNWSPRVGAARLDVGRVVGRDLEVLRRRRDERVGAVDGRVPAVAAARVVDRVRGQRAGVRGLAAVRAALVREPELLGDRLSSPRSGTSVSLITLSCGSVTSVCTST